MFKSFDTYLESITSSYQAEYKNTSKSKSLIHIHEQLKKCHSEHEHFGKVLEGLTALQLAMQGVLEAIILLDRAVFAMETKFCSSVEISNIFDAYVSPRCFALILYK